MFLEEFGKVGEVGERQNWDVGDVGARKEGGLEVSECEGGLGGDGFFWWVCGVSYW
jgi:hypothetical protein